MPVACQLSYDVVRTRCAAHCRLCGERIVDIQMEKGVGMIPFFRRGSDTRSFNLTQELQLDN